MGTNLQSDHSALSIKTIVLLSRRGRKERRFNLNVVELLSLKKFLKTLGVEKNEINKNSQCLSRSRDP